MNLNRLWIELTAWPLIVFSGASILSAQIGRGTITGIVRDPTGAAAPSVSVAAVNSATSVVFETTTNEGGTYTIGALSDQGQVTAEAPLLETETAQNSNASTIPLVALADHPSALRSATSGPRAEAAPAS